jgi:hypothetical protein
MLSLLYLALGRIFELLVLLARSRERKALESRMANPDYPTARRAVGSPTDGHRWFSGPRLADAQTQPMALDSFSRGLR